MQTKRMSMLETGFNLAAGLLLSIFVIQPIVFAIYDIHLGVGDNTAIAIIFTVVSFVRGYIVRRMFNRILVKRYESTI